MTARILCKLISGVLIVLLLALVTVDFLVSHVAESSYVQNLTRELGDKGRMLALLMQNTSQPDQQNIKGLAKAAGARVTIVARDGKVLADSETDPARMENHSTRPELVEAFRGAQGSSIRHSATIGVNFLYVAIPVPAGALRVAVPLSEIHQHLSLTRKKILASALLAFVPAIILATFLARSISSRFGAIMDYAGELATGNFRARLSRVDNSEFGQLARKLNESAENLQKTVEQLHVEHAALEKLERIRKDFVINVSHELRTPLASIQGYTETLMDGALYDGANNMRFLGIIRHNAERLARLTADLLTLSRIELKRHDFHFDTYPINDLLTEAVETIRPIAQKNNIRLSLDLSAGEIEAFCDSEAVSQILSNLLDNAIKYTPEGGQISVGAKLAAPWVEIYVRDTGVGIPREDLTRLFERFYRVDKARSRELGGTGLGLSIVKHLVLAHTGQIRVESQPNEGSTFYFTLPMERVLLENRDELNPELTVS